MRVYRIIWVSIKEVVQAGVNEVSEQVKGAMGPFPHTLEESTGLSAREQIG